MTDVVNQPDPFAGRLGKAIEQLSARHKEAIEAEMVVQGLDGGLKGGLARIVGMSGASTLSDMLSGRIRGQRYRADLAKWLGVHLAWLEGSDEASTSPEWALLPLAAYERWLKRVRIAWQAWFMDQRGGPSATTAMGFRLKSTSGGFSLSRDERRQLGTRLDLSEDDAVLESLSKGSWHEIPFAMQLAIAEELQAPPPENPEHVAAGHKITQEAAAQKDVVVERFRDQYLRYHLPPSCFQITRLALVTLMGQRHYQGKDNEAIRDSLEFLWRQHLQRTSRETATPPQEFIDETGRKSWSNWDDLCQRYSNDSDGDKPYESQIP